MLAKRKTACPPLNMSHKPEELMKIETLDSATGKRRRNRSISNASTLEGEHFISSDSDSEETLVFPTSNRRKVSESQSFGRNSGSVVVIVNSELEEVHRNLWARAAETLTELETVIEGFCIRDLRVFTRRITMHETNSSTLLSRRKCLLKVEDS